MALVLGFGAGFGYYVHLVEVQRDAIAAIEKAGGKAFYGWQLRSNRARAGFEDLAPIPNAQPRWPKWIVDRIGPDYYSTVWLVLVFGQADPVMPHVGRLGHVAELDFSPARKDPTLGPTDAGMVHLRNLTRLKHLKLGRHAQGRSVGSKITGRGLAELANLTGLQYLELEGIPLKDDDLAALRRLIDLRVLEIESPEVTDAGLAHLEGMVELKKLDLTFAKVTAAGIAHLRGLAKLERLNLAFSRIDHLDAFRSFPALAELTLAGTPIVDAGLVPAPDPDFPALTRLNLFKTHVGDAGLMHLRALPALKSINLAGTDVTPAGLAEFKNARPAINASIVAPGPTPRKAATPKKAA